MVKFQDWYTGGVIPTATQFSTHVGNTLVVTSDVGASFASGSDNNSNSYSLIAGDNTASNPQLVYSCGITPSANMTPVMVIGTGLSGSTALIGFWEVSGAANSNCLDTNATAANSSSLTAANSGASVRTGTVGAGCSGGCTVSDVPSLTPGTGNTDLMIDSQDMGIGPITGNTTMVFDFPYGAGLGDQNGYTNGDGLSHSVVATTLNSEPISISSGNQITGVMAAFKQAPSANINALPAIRF